MRPKTQTIMVPLDGTMLSERALPYAEQLARATGARVLLVQALSMRTAPETLGTVDRVRAAIEALEQEGGSYLCTVADQLAQRGVMAETRLLYGEAARSIAAEARSARVDAVVMVTHDGHGIGRLGYSSVAESVLAQVAVPVLLVRVWQPERPPSLAEGKPRLLVPLDGSEHAEAALGPATDLAASLGGELVLVRAVHGPHLHYFAAEMPAPEADDRLEAREEEALAYLRAVAERLARQGIEARLIVRVGEPAEVIARAGWECNAALVIMATLGLGDARGQSVGRVADEVLQRDNVPLMLVRPHADEAAAPPLATAVPGGRP